MAFFKLDKEKLKHNYKFLDDLFRKNNTEWGIVTKLLCGNEKFLREVLALRPGQVLDSRVQNLRTIKKIDPDIQTVYIKPPSKRSIPNVVRYADVSFNTEFETIKFLSDEAGRQGKLHKVIIMIEMGDLREGVMGEDLVDFYGKAFHLPNISIVGIGANLNCLHGVMPSKDKLIQLGLYRQVIELKFKRDIPWISGGTSVTLPLLFRKEIPKAVNHFRIGESLFFGKNLFRETTIKGMKDDLFMLYSEVIEISKKPITPFGELGSNLSGDTHKIDDSQYGKEISRAILDIGLLEIDPKNLNPIDKSIEIVGASSDMLIIDVTNSKRKYRIGDLIKFKVDYLGALGVLNSNYIEKIVD
jgi:predicted amino acid racemase